MVDDRRKIENEAVETTLAKIHQSFHEEVDKFIVELEAVLMALEQPPKSGPAGDRHA